MRISDRRTLKQTRRDFAQTLAASMGSHFEGFAVTQELSTVLLSRHVEGEEPLNIHLRPESRGYTFEALYVRDGSRYHDRTQRWFKLADHSGVLDNLDAGDFDDIVIRLKKVVPQVEEKILAEREAAREVKARQKRQRAVADAQVDTIGKALGLAVPEDFLFASYCERTDTLRVTLRTQLAIFEEATKIES